MSRHDIYCAERKARQGNPNCTKAGKVLEGDELAGVTAG
jgi:hypothetical protein